MSVEIDLTRLLCLVSDLQATGCREFRLGGGDWPLRGFVVRAKDGVRAYVNRCAHLRLPLNYQPDRFFTHDGSHIMCYVHGAIFTKDTGLCIAGPCSGQSLARVPVRVAGDCVLLADEVDADELVARYS